jgi:hypothetical protein
MANTVYEVLVHVVLVAVQEDLAQQLEDDFTQVPPVKDPAKDH